jgi:nicotinamidase-related amidase
MAAPPQPASSSGAPSVASLRLDPQRAALLVVDVQERLAAAMDPQRFAACQRNILTLVELARLLRLPVVLSEQVPQKLGPTVPAIAAAVRQLAPAAPVHGLEKICFAATDDAEFPALFERVARSQWIVVGLEAHICVYQSARGLRALGADVQLPADATLSRSPENHGIGLGLTALTGAVVTSTEALAFDALGRAGTEEFKIISGLVK